MIVLLTIIFLASLINWIFIPLIVFFQTLFFPIILAVVLFYLTRPCVRWLSKRMPKTLSILVLYLGIVTLFVVLLTLIVPELQRQFQSLINSMPLIVAEIQLMLIQLQQHELVERFDLAELFQFEEQVEQVGLIINNVLREIVPNTIGFVGAVFNVIIALFVIPFILFYLLKEGEEKFPRSILRFIPKDRQEEARHIIRDLDTTLSNYIQGVLIVCLFIGILCYTAFSIIGLDYALILALFAMVTNVIPYLGPWIGAVPAVIVGIIHSPFMMLLVIVIVIIIQQIESIFVQPQVMGRKLSMHPVTVLFLVLVAGRFAGILGMILAIPLYALGKVFVTHSYRLWKVRQGEESIR
ncbi:membrane protein YrrI [Halalkalibacter wakoensis JCM 9140]|uniref:Membrane protein YrrI n=2 Tax=Halalkalibacter wakoensis TaxID=127891 RepID=W4Q5W3_9BACI|nr:membrane protein YrrI [Halalkalibacter wakoensis JCM 9140]